MPKMSQLDQSRNGGADRHQRQPESPLHQTGSDQQECLSESWPCFSGNSLDYLGFRVSLYTLMDQTRGKYSQRKLFQIIMYNCFSDEIRLKLGFCANLADLFNKLRRLVLSPEYLAKSYSEVIERWNKVAPNDVSSELKFLKKVLKMERISRGDNLEKAFYSRHVFELFLGKISDEM